MTGESVPRRLPKYCYEDVDRYGTVRVYLRRVGHKKILIPGAPWSEGFMLAYNQALGKIAAAIETPVETETWQWLCRKYFASTDLKKLSSRAIRRRILERTFLEPREPGSLDLFKDFPLSMMGVAAIKVLHARLATTPEAANERLKAIRQVFKYGISEGLVGSNPAKDVGYNRSSTDGFYTWTEADIAQYAAYHPAGTKARLALLLALAMGPRRQDACRVGRQHLKDGVLKFKPKKTAGKTGVEVEIPVPDYLAAEIELMPPGRMLFIETQFGKPYSVAGFGNWFKRQCKLAGLPQCSIHGLRKAGATQRAENGATPYDLMGLYGWTSTKTAEVYTRKAQRKKLAARAVGLIAQLQLPIGQKARK